MAQLRRLWRALAPPKELLTRLRWLYLGFGFFYMATYVPQVIAGSHRPMGIRLASVVLLVAMGLWWLRCYRRGSFPVAGLAIEAAAFVACILTPADPFKGLGLLYIAVNFRAMYGGIRRALSFAGFALVCFLGAVLIAPHIGSMDRTDLVGYVIPGVVPLSIIASLVARACNMAARAAARERLLSRVGLAVAECSDPDEIRATGLAAVNELVAAAPGTTAEFAGMDPPPDAAPAVLDLPIQVDGKAADHLRISGHEPLPPEIGDALWVLVAQLGLALRNAELTESLRRQAARDALTGLANRRAIEEHAAIALASGPVGVIMLDLDGFKQVNDLLGHAAGDALLVELAVRMAPLIGPHDVLGRLGGDEFVILLGQVRSEADVQALAQSVLEVVRRPVRIQESTVAVGGSLGVVVGRAGDSRDALLAAADSAMYEAKRAGKNCIRVVPCRELPALIN